MSAAARVTAATCASQPEDGAPVFDRTAGAFDRARFVLQDDGSWIGTIHGVSVQVGFDLGRPAQLPAYTLIKRRSLAERYRRALLASWP